MPVTTRAETVNRPEEFAPPDVAKIMTMERRQDRLAALEDVFRMVLGQRHGLSVEDLGAIRQDFDNRAVFRPESEVRSIIGVDAGMLARVRQQRDRFGRVVEETSVQYWPGAEEPLLSATIKRLVNHYGSEGKDRDIVKQTQAKLIGFKSMSDMQDVSTYWVRPYFDTLRDIWCYVDTHEMLVRCIGGVTANAHVVARGGHGRAEYSARAEFAEGQITLAGISDLNKDKKQVFKRQTDSDLVWADALPTGAFEESLN